jgi:hypothetical protein
MTLVYEVPTHLNVEDQLLFGLSARQLVRVMAAGSIAYGLWDQATLLPDSVRAVFAGFVAVFGLAVAVLEPGGRPLDQWILAATLYLLLPHRFGWRPDPQVDLADETTNDWEDLVPLPGWIGVSATDEDDHLHRTRPTNHAASRRSHWRAS